MPKFFSVVTEMEDGKTKIMPVRGKSSSDVFQKIKGVAGLRRVGKVTEISEAVHDAMLHGKSPNHAPRTAPKAADPARPSPAEPSAPPAARTTIGHVISGPRVVSHVVRTGGEQPFKHLKPPPEKPPREYRVIKSRRADGQPFLLQRGNWHVLKGKRVFTVEWEKGFADRAGAEKHEAWVKKSELEMAE